MKKCISLPGYRIILFAAAFFITTMQISAQVTISSKKDVTCHGAKDGSASASVTGGTPPYTYHWTPTGGNGPTASGLSGGDYKIEVTDANNCKASANVTILEPTALSVSISGGGAEVEYCSNQKPPSVTLTASASGGVPPYSYSWPGGSITVNSSGTWSVTVTDKKGCSKTASATTVFTPVLCSQDPNDISGPEGYDTLHWIQKDMVMPFVVRFENDPEFATAPAQKVTINQEVDPNMNIFSFRLGDFGFGDFTFQVPANTTFYSQRLDVRDSLGVFVDVLAGIDIVNNELFWIFESIDPLTGQSPADARIGFLPVNDSIRQQGEGFISYTILPKTTVNSGDTILAQAVIVFDVNESIATNVWKNTIDAIAPTSHVVDNFTTYSDTTSIPIIFNGNDDPNGTGIKSYNLYFSKNNGPYTFYQEFSADTLATFNTTSGYYKFYSIAVDYVGNQEAPKNAPDADINIISNLKYAVEGILAYANFNKTPLHNSLVYLKTPGGDKIDSVSTSNTGFYHIGNIGTGLWVLEGAQCQVPWGGVNATDALMINRAAIQLISLDSIQNLVADVNASNTITATDALLALRRSLGLDNFFDAGDWYYLPDTVMVKGDTLYDHFLYGQCVGDVNRSYQPANAKMFRSVTPVYEGFTEVATKEFIYPLYILNPSRLGALTLTLNYPADQVEIAGITYKGNDILYNDMGGLLRIGWQDLKGENFGEKEMLLGIRMRYTPGLLEESTLQPTLAEPSELADEQAQILWGSQIILPEVKLRKELPGEFALIGNYPNPCDQYTRFQYQIPEPGNVEIRVYNTLGELVKFIQLGDQEAGEYTTELSTSALATGVYQYTLSVKNTKEESSASGRFVIGTRN